MATLTTFTFADYLYAAGMARSTVLDFDRAIEAANRWLRTHGFTVDNVPGGTLSEFVATLPHTYGTRRRFQLAIGHYWTHVARPDPPLGAIPVPRQPKARCRALSEDDARLLAKTAKGWPASQPEGLAVLLGLYMAMRRAEIGHMEWTDICGDELTILGKGHKFATLPLHPALVPYLDRWRLHCPHPRWVFPGRSGTGPVCPTTVGTWVQRVAEQAGVPATTHQLRHTCLATMNDGTGDLRLTSVYARHERVTTTMVYTRTTKRRLVAGAKVLEEAY